MEESHTTRNNLTYEISNCDDSSSDSHNNLCLLPKLNSSQANLSSELSQSPEAVSFYADQQFSKFEDLEQHLKLYEEQ